MSSKSLKSCEVALTPVSLLSLVLVLVERYHCASSEGQPDDGRGSTVACRRRIRRDCADPPDAPMKQQKQKQKQKQKQEQCVRTNQCHQVATFLRVALSACFRICRIADRCAKIRKSLSRQSVCLLVVLMVGLFLLGAGGEEGGRGKGVAGLVLLVAVVGGLMLKSTLQLQLQASFVEWTCADEANAIRGMLNVMKDKLITIFLVVCQIIIEDQVLDALLLSALGFLL